MGLESRLSFGLVPGDRQEEPEIGILVLETHGGKVLSRKPEEVREAGRG